MRSTINEHLFCFKRYSKEKCMYLNVFNGIPSYIARLQFDLIIYHYTFTAMKWNTNEFKALLSSCSLLKRIAGHKIAIPQDEYVHSDIINDFLSDFEIKTLFTCLPETEYTKVYPKSKSGVENLYTVNTGYIDENSFRKIGMNSLPMHSVRPIDIGYRARKLPFWLGSHGLIKSELTERFLKVSKGYEMNIDVSNDPQKAFVGMSWYRFLMNCRVVLGCEGGASIHDPAGIIKESVDSYVMQNPDSTFGEVEEKCFPGIDGNLALFALSPRHFECCMTKTCQALIEGEYGGVLKPGIHYIEIKKDWSNIKEVLVKCKDMEYCEKIAEKAFSDVVLSGSFTYSKFVKFVFSKVDSLITKDTDNKNDKNLLRIFKIHLTLLNIFEPLFISLFRIRKFFSRLKKFSLSLLNTSS